jgi:hypothetical protein
MSYPDIDYVTMVATDTANIWIADPKHLYEMLKKKGLLNSNKSWQDWCNDDDILSNPDEWVCKILTNGDGSFKIILRDCGDQTIMHAKACESLVVKNGGKPYLY